MRRLSLLSFCLIALAAVAGGCGDEGITDGDRTDGDIPVSCESDADCLVPGEVCAARWCDTADSTCRFRAYPDGSVCYAGNREGSCVGGACEPNRDCETDNECAMAGAACRDFWCDEQAGFCRSQPVADGTECFIGTPANPGLCQGGVCVPQVDGDEPVDGDSPVDGDIPVDGDFPIDGDTGPECSTNAECAVTGDVCRHHWCDAGSGRCRTMDKQDGTACNPYPDFEGACRSGECIASGQCRTDAECLSDEADYDPCRRTFCDRPDGAQTGVCRTGPVEDGTPCPMGAPGNWQCWDGRCIQVTGCVDDGDCGGDGDQCREWWCERGDDAAGGVCRSRNLEDGTECFYNGQYGGGRCESGQCLPVRECASDRDCMLVGASCADYWCDQATGLCDGKLWPDGTECFIGTPNNPGVCRDGQCVPIDVECREDWECSLDGATCTDFFCSNGRCASTPWEDGTECFRGGNPNYPGVCLDGQCVERTECATSQQCRQLHPNDQCRIWYCGSDRFCQFRPQQDGIECYFADGVQGECSGGECVPVQQRCESDEDCWNQIGCPEMEGIDTPRCNPYTGVCYCGGVCGDRVCDEFEREYGTCWRDCENSDACTDAGGYCLLGDFVGCEPGYTGEYDPGCPDIMGQGGVCCLPQPFERCADAGGYCRADGNCPSDTEAVYTPDCATGSNRGMCCVPGTVDSCAEEGGYCLDGGTLQCDRGYIGVENPDCPLLMGEYGVCCVRSDETCQQRGGYCAQDPVWPPCGDGETPQADNSCPELMGISGVCCLPGDPQQDCLDAGGYCTCPTCECTAGYHLPSLQPMGCYSESGNARRCCLPDTQPGCTTSRDCGIPKCEDMATMECIQIQPECLGGQCSISEFTCMGMCDASSGQCLCWF